MRKFIMTTAVCFWAMSQMMAQNISGKIVDAKGEPLAFANVVLLYRQDSAFVNGDCEWRRMGVLPSTPLAAVESSR